MSKITHEQILEARYAIVRGDDKAVCKWVYEHIGKQRQLCLTLTKLIKENNRQEARALLDGCLETYSQEKTLSLGFLVACFVIGAILMLLFSA